MRAVLTASVVVAALALSAHAPLDAGVAGSGMAAAEPRQCFNIQQIRNFNQGRSDQIFLRVGRNDVYELDTGGGCPDTDFAIRMVVVPDTAGAVGSRLCTDDWARIVVPGEMPQRAMCRAHVSRKLTAEQVAALPAAHRP